MTDDGHSALYLTDARDLWWNQDFLALIAARLSLHRARRVLDVGAGHGHWTRTIAQLVAPAADVVGVEREPRWVERASAGPPVAGRSLRFIQGVAEALPFQDAVFDVATCQTLLIHVKEPRTVVSEMLRVLAPGGVLLLVEPNNLGDFASLVSRPDFDLEDVITLFRLQAICERGPGRACRSDPGPRPGGMEQRSLHGVPPGHPRRWSRRAAGRAANRR